jgi:hypothetical protein
MRSSMLKASAVIGFALVALGVCPSAAQATIITLNYNFVATDFPAGAPVDPVVGSFSVSFDNGSDLVDVTDGLTASINLPLTLGIGFSYFRSTDLFLIGDLLIGGPTSPPAPFGPRGGVDSQKAGTNDFGLGVTTVSTNPTPGILDYTTVGANTFFGTESFSLLPRQVPEPATLSLLGVALAAAGMRHYRRRACLARYRAG